MADPKRTHALVVGIERYRAGSSWDLNGPAKDARLFVDWLRSQQVPEGQITLLLAPLDKNAAAMEGSPKALRASRDSIRQALNDLHEKTGDLLVLFWGGHGVLGEEKNRRLFYPDATLDDKQNLDLDDLLGTLRSDYFTGFPSQICFVDACANYVEDMQLAYKLPKDNLPAGGPLYPEPGQFVLLAGRAGEVAKNLGAEGRGQFSKIVLAELAGDAAWPPDMDELQTRVWERFEDLRLQGKASQTPIYRWQRGGTGSERLAQDLAALRAAHLERFVRVGRDDRAEVETAAEGLLGVLDLKALYLQSLPSRTAIDAKARTLPEILFDLAKLPPQAGGAFSAPLLEFVERLALKVEAVEPAIAKRLRSWVDSKAPDLDVDPAAIEELRDGLSGGQAPEAHAHVLVEVAPDFHDPERFLLRVWGCAPEPIYLPPEDLDPRPRPLEEAQQILLQFLEDLPDYAPKGADLTLEIFLPRRLLCWDLDQWKIQVGRILKTPVGIQHRIVVRWLNRTSNKTAERHWERKWNSFRSKDLPVENSVFWLDSRRQIDLESLYLDLYDRADVFCLGLAFSPPEAPEVEDLLETVLEAGMPIAFWLRRCGDDPQLAKQSILKALDGKRSAELPEAVREARLQAYKTKEKDHVGNHLTLLWDDAGRKLPGAKKPLARPRLEGGHP